MSRMIQVAVVWIFLIILILIQGFTYRVGLKTQHPGWIGIITPQTGELEVLDLAEQGQREHLEQAAQVLQAQQPSLPNIST